MKFLPEGVAFSANSLERFRNEVRLARHVSHPNVCRAYGAAVVFWYSALIGLLYLALEPTVRRRWPQTLIAWTRLLDGRYGDPLVGAHVLVGTAQGVGAIVVARVLFVLTRQFAATPGLDRLDTVPGARHFAGSLISNAVTALGTAVALLFLVLLLRVVLRRNWAVATVFLLLCVAGTDRTGSPVLGVVVGLVVGATILLATQRYGLLATFVMLAVFTTTANSVQTLDPSHWYFGFSLAVLLQLVAVAAYGFRTSLGERRLLRDEFFG